MTDRSLVVLLAVSLALAGCTAAPTTSPEGNDPGESAMGGTPPGVTDGELTNASALMDAHETSLNESGFAATVTHSLNGSEVASYDVVATAGLGQYALSGTQTGGGSTVEVGLWANETHRLVRYQSGGEARYHAAQRGADSFNPITQAGPYIRVGNFSVNGTTDDGYTVLTSDELAPNATDDYRFEDATAVSGRAVVDETGRVHELTVTVEQPHGSETYSFELQRTNVTSVDRPAWLDDVPSGAFLSPELTVDVEDESMLSIRNEGGDAVPAKATLTLTMNDETYRATFEEPLEPGEVRYAAIAADDGTLQLTAEHPAANEIESLTSPISVSIETEGGVSLYSAGMGWDSSSASDETSGGSSSGGSSSGSGSESG